MKYSVDRIENDVVILQNLTNGLIKEEKKSSFLFDVKEKDIVVNKKDKYVLDLDAKNNRLRLLKEKMEKLKSKEWLDYEINVNWWRKRWKVKY